MASSIAEVQALVGQELGVSPWLTVTQEQVQAFADLTSDHQYIHVDPERARQTMYGGTIAHGYFTLSSGHATEPRARWHTDQSALPHDHQLWA